MSERLTQPAVFIAISEQYRITENNQGDRRYSTRDMGVNYPYPAAEYFIQSKWYPGFNDYPFGEDYDYSDGNFKIISQWITGAFDA